MKNKIVAGLLGILFCFSVFAKSSKEMIKILEEGDPIRFNKTYLSSLHPDTIEIIFKQETNKYPKKYMAIMKKYINN